MASNNLATKVTFHKGDVMDILYYRLNLEKWGCVKLAYWPQRLLQIASMTSDGLKTIITSHEAGMGNIFHIRHNLHLWGPTKMGASFVTSTVGFFTLTKKWCDIGRKNIVNSFFNIFFYQYHTIVKILKKYWKIFYGCSVNSQCNNVTFETFGDSFLPLENSFSFWVFIV